MTIFKIHGHSTKNKYPGNRNFDLVYIPSSNIVILFDLLTKLLLDLYHLQEGSGFCDGPDRVTDM